MAARATGRDEGEVFPRAATRGKLRRFGENRGHVEARGCAEAIGARRLQGEKANAISHHELRTDSLAGIQGEKRGNGQPQGANGAGVQTRLRLPERLQRVDGSEDGDLNDPEQLDGDAQFVSR